jgi:hypothetical protein
LGTNDKYYKKEIRNHQNFKFTHWIFQATATCVYEPNFRQFASSTILSIKSLEISLKIGCSGRTSDIKILLGIHKNLRNLKMFWTPSTLSGKIYNIQLDTFIKEFSEIQPLLLVAKLRLDFDFKLEGDSTSDMKFRQFSRHLMNLTPNIEELHVSSSSLVHEMYLEEMTKMQLESSDHGQIVPFVTVRCLVS